MIEMFKIMTGKYDPKASNFIPLNTNVTRGHNHKILKVHTRLDKRKYSFVHRSANLWNNLPLNVVNAPNVNSF